eukprot:NODE_20_length_39102_cov_0.325513.p6 type:complete len:611 gc:universal NODE_20_length_39102_cov_0.325513:31108-32940(+)
MSFLFKSWSAQIGDKVSSCGTLDLHKYKDSYIFQSQNKDYYENILKRIKTLQHPGILKCKIENDQIFTNEAIPLFKHQMSQELLVLGFHQLYKTLKFLHTQDIMHGNISEETIFLVNGEFKLFGLDICSPIKNNLLYKASNLKIIQLYPSNPDPSTIDAVLLYKLACQLGLGSTLSQYDILKWPDALFGTHWLIHISEGLSNFTILNQNERQQLLSLINKHQADLPKDLCIRVIIDLINAYLYANGGKPVLNTLIALLPKIPHNDHLNDQIYELFATKDIDDRIIVLQHIQSFKVFFNTSLGGKILKLQVDTNHANPHYREYQMRALITLCEFVDQKQRDNDLIRLVLAYQMDPEPIIRTNSAIGLGKIAPFLSKDVYRRVVPSSLMRGLRDPFPPCRAANLTALSVCCLEMDVELLATQLLPLTAPLSVDKDPQVRQQALKCFDALINRIKEYNPPSPVDKQQTDESSSSWGFSLSKYVKSPAKSETDPIPKSASNVTINPTRAQEERASLPQPVHSAQVKEPGNEWDAGWEDQKITTPMSISIQAPFSTVAASKSQAMKLDSNTNNTTTSEWGNWDEDLPVVDNIKKTSTPKENSVISKEQGGWDVDW